MDTIAPQQSQRSSSLYPTQIDALCAGLCAVLRWSVVSQRLHGDDMLAGTVRHRFRWVPNDNARCQRAIKLVTLHEVVCRFAIYVVALKNSEG